MIKTLHSFTCLYSIQCNKKPAKSKTCGLILFCILKLSLLKIQYLVPMAGFEPARLASPPPQDGVSTNFTTSAKNYFACSASPAALGTTGTSAETGLLAALGTSCSAL